MGLAVLVAMVVIGVSLVVASVHLTGGSKRASLRDAAQARQLFASDYPDIATSTADLTTDGENAFLLLPGGAIGIVHVVGDGFLTRLITGADVASVQLRPPATLSLRFRDFTWAGGHFTFSDPATMQRLASALQPNSARTSEGA